MSDELYLVAHKVRGEPAFDIAQHLTCPKCNATDDHCTACDGVGHWWIVPTSGHRAYPIMNWLLSDLRDRDKFGGHSPFSPLDEAGPLEHHAEFIAVRDHYAVEQEIAINLMHALGLSKPPTPSAPIIRRF